MAGHTCMHCSFIGERGKCERPGTHHAPYCPRFLARCKFCNCRGGYERVTKEHGQHQSFCPRFRGKCKMCGVTGAYEEIAMTSPFHKTFCERFSERCHFCGAPDGAIHGGHHQVKCSRFRGECKHCNLVGSSWYVTTHGRQHAEGCPRRWDGGLELQLDEDTRPRTSSVLASV